MPTIIWVTSSIDFRPQSDVVGRPRALDAFLKAAMHLA
jgi:hypothetical protein